MIDQLSLVSKIIILYNIFCIPVLCPRTEGIVWRNFKGGSKGGLKGRDSSQASIFLYIYIVVFFLPIKFYENYNLGPLPNQVSGAAPDKLPSIVYR